MLTVCVDTQERYLRAEVGNLTLAIGAHQPAGFRHRSLLLG